MNKIGKFFLGFTLLLVVASWILPNEFQVEKSILIKTDKAELYHAISDLKAWPQWAPWNDAEEEQVIIQYGKKTRGVGATQRWKSDDGAGRLIITEDDPDKGIVYSLYFDHFPEKNVCSLSFRPEGDGFRVSWKMDGIMSYPILGKFMVVLFKPLIADMFEQGLQNLKHMLEKEH